MSDENVVPQSGIATFAGAMNHETFGGHLQKKNYGGIAVVNPKTDVSAQQGVDGCRVLARAQWTMKFAELEITLGDDDTASTVNSYVGQNGVGLSKAPSIARIGTGIVRLQWDATYTDEYNITGTLAIKRAKGTPCGTVFSNPVCNRVDARTVDVRFFDAAGALVDNRSAVIEVATMGDS